MKFSAETLMKKYSRKFWTQMSWNLRKNHMDMQVLELSAKEASAEMLFIWKTIKNQIFWVTSSWKNAASSFGKKLKLMQRSGKHLHKFLATQA